MLDDRQREAASDDLLYQHLRAGDEAALEVLVQRYHAPILGFVSRQLGDRHLAEDLTQEIFMRLVTYRGAAPVRFRPWLFTIAANLVRDEVRSGYYRRETGVSDERTVAGLSDPAPSSDERLVRDDERQVVRDALQRLPLDQRMVLTLRFYHELKLDEIAEAMGTPIGTVKSRLFHALKRMKQYLGCTNETDDREDTDEASTHIQYCR